MAPETTPIPLFEPNLSGNEWKYIKECLDTNWVSSVGSYVDRFESMTAALAGKKRSVATVNGTAALHIALKLAGVREDDEVLVSDLTFIAPANAVRYLGAHPVFIDAEPEYWQMDVPRAVEFLTDGCRRENGVLRNRKTGRRVSALLPVDILGHPMDLEPLLRAAKEFDLPVVEDASEALGSLYRGRPTGAGADISCFSFNGNKLVTTGGGGALATDRDDWADRAKHLTTQAKAERVEYIHDEIAYNYRLTNVLAALGVAQLEQLSGFVSRKREIAKRYREGLAGIPGVTPMPEAPWAESTFWMYTILIDESVYGLDRKGLLAALEAEKIVTRPLWQPMHMSPPHAASQSIGGERAERLYREALNLPSSTNLSDAQADRVCSAIRDCAR